jgi:hypothetical protein
MEAVIRPEFRPVTFAPINWHLGDAAELLRDPLRDADIPREALKRLRKAFDDILVMASGKSNYLKAAMRNEVLGAVAFGAPANAYFALWTTAAATDMSAYHGGTAGEVTGGSYDRVTKTNNTSNFATIAGAAAKVNTTAITWVTASANWNSSAVIPQLGVFDGNAKTSGDNLLVWGDFTTAKAVLNGDTAQINASAFSWTET